MSTNKYNLLLNRTFQYLGIILIVAAMGGGYWYWKQAQAGVAQKAANNQGLVGYWSFDEGTGTQAGDASGQGNTGTLTNGPTWVDGKLGKAANFDGTDDYASVVNSSSLQFSGAVPITLSVWVNPAQNTAYSTFLVKGRDTIDNAANYAIRQSSSGKKLEFYFNQTGSVSWHVWSSTSDIFTSTSTWYHVTIAYTFGTAGSIVAYVNGSPIAGSWITGSGSATADVDTQALVFGRITSGERFSGKLDEVRIFNRALEATEITNLYNLGAAKLQKTQSSDLTNGLVGYWPFNGKDVSGTTAYDRSGQGNNGTLTNGPTVTEGRSGQALAFNGSNQSINCGVLATKPATSVTVSSWIKKTGSSTDQWLIVNGRDGLHYTPEFIFEIDPSGRVAFFDYNQAAGGYGFSAATNHSTNAVNDGLWHHIAFTKNGVNGIFYVDGVANGTSTAAINIDYSSISGPLAIGGDIRDSGSYYFGAIDEPRIYNRALSASEIWDLYQMGNSDKVNSADSQGDSLEKGMVGYWKLDDASGTSATDSSGNANTGTLTNGPTWTTGQIGGATDFDGTNDYVDAGNGSSLRLNGPLTMSFWMYGRGSSVDAYIAGTAGTNLEGYSCTHHNGATVYCYVQSGANSVSAAVGTNTWAHITLTWDGTTGTNGKKLYVNGTLQSQGTSSQSALSGWGNFRIGEDATATRTRFNGKVDELRVYNRVLSAEEVTKLYKTTAPDNPDTGLVGYWSFNGKDLSGTTAYDRSGKGNNGTLTNGPTVTEGKAGQGLHFDGSDDRINYGNISALKPSFPFTITAWVKGTSGAVFSNGKGEYFCSPATPYSDNYSGVVFYMNGGIAGGNGGGQSAGSRFERAASVSAADGEWHHIAAVLQAGNNINLYKDGSLNNGSYDDGTATTIGYDTRPALVGASYGCGYLYPANGRIDEVRIYNRALSVSEIQALYNVGR